MMLLSLLLQPGSCSSQTDIRGHAERFMGRAAELSSGGVMDDVTRENL